MEYKEEAPEYGGSEMYAERHVVVRGAYEIRNSVLEEQFDARRAADGAKQTQTVYHGTGFAAGCAIIHDGGFKTRGVTSHSGQTLGPGVYVGRSTGKVIPYASTGQCYAAELAELMYEKDDYSQGGMADDVIFRMRMSSGKKKVTAKSISGAHNANKNCGGSADVVELPAGHGYKAWEAVASSSDLVCPDIMVDTGLRYKYITAGIHSKNMSGLTSYGPAMAAKTNC